MLQSACKSSENIKICKETIRPAVAWQQAGPSPQTLPWGGAESPNAFSMETVTLPGPPMVELETLPMFTFLKTNRPIPVSFIRNQWKTALMASGVSPHLYTQFKLKKPNSEKIKKSFTYEGRHEWNALPASLHHTATKGEFKALINDLIIQKAIKESV